MNKSKYVGAICVIIAFLMSIVLLILSKTVALIDINGQKFTFMDEIPKLNHDDVVSLFNKTIVMTVLSGVVILYVIIMDKRINKRLYVLIGVLLLAAYLISIIIAVSQLLNINFPTGSSYDIPGAGLGGATIQIPNNFDTIYEGSKITAYASYAAGGLGIVSLLIHFFVRLY